MYGSDELFLGKRLHLLKLELHFQCFLDGIIAKESKCVAADPPGDHYSCR